MQKKHLTNTTTQRSPSVAVQKPFVLLRPATSESSYCTLWVTQSTKVTPTRPIWCPTYALEIAPTCTNKRIICLITYLYFWCWLTNCAHPYFWHISRLLQPNQKFTAIHPAHFFWTLTFISLTVCFSLQWVLQPHRAESMAVDSFCSLV